MGGTSKRKNRTGIALPVLLALAGLLLLPSSALASLSWSSPQLIDEASPSEGIGLTGISCASPSFCVAVDKDGNVLTSTNPTGAAEAWTVTHVDSTMDNPIFGGNGIISISCPSVSLCVAGDANGNVLTSTNPTGGAEAWTVTHVDGENAIPSIDCFSASLCVAGDQAGNVLVSTNPTGGAGAWTISNIAGSGIPPFYEPILGIACPSASLCVAADDTGSVHVSTNPTGGAGTWVSAPIITGNLFGLGCASTSLCIAITADGRVSTSTDPAGGAEAWHEAAVANGNELYAVSCPSVSLCVTGGFNGEVTESSNPTGGTAAWSTLQVFGGDPLKNYLSGVSCPTTSLCIAANGTGNVAVGTPAESGGGTESAGSDPSPPPTLSSNPTPTSKPKPRKKPLKCRKGFKKRMVHGKARCVKVERHHHSAASSSRATASKAGQGECQSVDSPSTSPKWHGRYGFQTLSGKPVQSVAPGEVVRFVYRVAGGNVASFNLEADTEAPMYRFPKAMTILKRGSRPMWAHSGGNPHWAIGGLCHWKVKKSISFLVAVDGHLGQHKHRLCMPFDAWARTGGNIEPFGPPVQRSCLAVR